ncbi:MAG: hypothetical protein IJ104_06965 [Methanobrevibacter sp.]|nr:hypothetical protein [Methanobrevibacter sp.]
MASKESLNLTGLFYKKSETRTRTEITNEIQDSIRDSEIIQGKVNKTDIKDNLISTDTDKPLSANQGKVLKGLVDTKANTSTVTALETSLNNRVDTVEDDINDVETSLNNKVDKVTGKGLSSNDYTTAEKNKLNGIETGANKTVIDNALNPNSTNPVQNKVICESFYDKPAIIDLLNNIQTSSGKLLTVYIDEETGDLVVDDDSYHYYTSDEVDANFTIDVVKQATADTGFFATYVIKQGNKAIGTKINIPKDYLLKSATIKTATAPISGTDIKTGDKYFDFVFNTKDSGSSDEHMYLNATSLVDTYTADETTLTMDSNNTFSVKSVPVAKITGVLPANQVTHQDISGKVDKETGKGLSANDFTNAYKTKLDNLDSNLNNKVDKVTGKGLSTNDYTSTEKTKLEGIETGANKTVVDSSFITNSTNPVQSKIVKSALDSKANSNDLATVATSGSYNDLSNKPTSMTPTSHTHNISDVTNLQSTLNSKMSTSDYSTVNLSVVFEDDTTGSYDLVYRNTSS